MTIIRTGDENLWGSTTTTSAGITVTFAPLPADPDDGTAGVREPRRPKPTAPAMAAAIDNEMENA